MRLPWASLWDLKDRDGPESLGNGSVAGVEGRVGGDYTYFGLLEVVFLKVAEYLVSADHVESLARPSTPL